MTDEEVTQGQSEHMEDVREGDGTEQDQASTGTPDPASAEGDQSQPQTDQSDEQAGDAGTESGDAPEE